MVEIYTKFIELWLRRASSRYSGSEMPQPKRFQALVERFGENRAKPMKPKLLQPSFSS